MAEITYKCTIIRDMGKSYDLQRFNQIREHLAASNITEAVKKLVCEYIIKEVRLHAAIVESPSHESITYLSPQAVESRRLSRVADGKEQMQGIIMGEEDILLELLIKGRWIPYPKRKELNEIAA